MSKINLLPNEGILKQDSQITHEKANGKGSWQAELILTNLALIVVHKGTFGGAKETLRFPFDQVKVVGGAPQAVPGRSSQGEQQLHVHFMKGVEAFSLGASSEDEVSIKSIFAFQSEKEKRNVQEWCAAISRAVLGDFECGSMRSQSHAPQSQNAVGNVVGAIGASLGGLMSQPPSSEPAVSAATCATMRCIGCMAPLSGERGQKTVCKYCDTEQVVQ